MLYAILTLALIALDRLTKVWAQQWLLRRHGGEMNALPGLFRFHYAENTGVAFSMLAGSRWIIIGLNGLLIAGILAFLILRRPQNRLLKVGLCMVVAGGAGNLIDRVALGYVIDFIDLTFMRFAVFNAADICVTIGAGLAALGMLIKGGGGADGVDA
jgi:signal peptidase II